MTLTHRNLLDRGAISLGDYVQQAHGLRAVEYPTGDNNYGAHSPCEGCGKVIKARQPSVFIAGVGFLHNQASCWQE